VCYNLCNNVARFIYHHQFADENLRFRGLRYYSFGVELGLGLPGLMIHKEKPIGFQRHPEFLSLILSLESGGAWSFQPPYSGV
jgi:hypothetical protein